MVGKGCCSVNKSCPTLCDPMNCSTPGFLSFIISLSLLKLMFIESVMPSNHLILCCPLLLLPSIFPSIRLFSNESVLRIRWPKYWSFSFGIKASNEYSGLISFRMDWLDLLVAQGALKSLLSSTKVWKHWFFSIKSSLWLAKEWILTEMDLTWDGAKRILCILQEIMVIWMMTPHFRIWLLFSH